jgi:predicted DsbA family dithiol-disulfide isomerase
MRVEIWSDVICPWCYIGKRRFEQAIAEYEGADDVEIVFRPYQLDPTASPGSATPVREAYARKFGGYEKADQIMGHVTSVAAGSGLEFHMERAIRANTLLAHRLLWLAEHEGDQPDMKERLLQAYFMDGENVGDPETLARIAVDAGLAADRVDAVLHGPLGLAEVRQQLEEGQNLGISAVPTYVFDGRWSVPGAQDPEVFLNVLRRVRTMEDQAAAEASAADATCTDESCEV